MRIRIYNQRRDPVTGETVALSEIRYSDSEAKTIGEGKLALAVKVAEFIMVSFFKGLARKRADDKAKAKKGRG